MEVLLGLIALVVILSGLIALIVASIALGRANRAQAENAQLTERLTELELEVYRLRNRSGQTPDFPSSKPTSGPQEPGAEPVKTDITTELTPAPEVPEMADTFNPPEIPPEVPLPEPVLENVRFEAEVPPIITAPLGATTTANTAGTPEVESGKKATAAPPPFIPKLDFTPSPSEPELAAPKESIEMRVGTYWLVRIGIVMLLTGLAFFANYAYHHVVPKLGPGGKISLLYLASGLLLGAGAWWQRRNVKESLKNYAQVLFAGGLAAVYFTTYAAHHIPPLRIIESAAVDGTLLLGWAGVIAWIADRRKSEVMALFAVGLAFYSSVITRVGDFTLYSNLVLTIAAVVFLIRNRWISLSFAGLATSYAGYAFWRFLHEDGWRWAQPDEHLGFGASFLAAYWLVFTVATFWAKNEKLSGKSRAAFLTLNNGAFFALFLLTMIQVHTGGFWKFSLGYGTALLALTALAKKMLPEEPLTQNAYLTQGLLLVTLGFITKFAGLQLALVLGVETVVLYFLALQRGSAVLKFFAYAAAGLATGWCLVSLESFAVRGLWTGLALGGLMAVNAIRAHRLEAKYAEDNRRLESTAFTLLAFISWTATTWFNSAEPHLPVTLVLAVESLVLYNLVARRVSLAPKFFSVVTAGLGLVWCAVNGREFDSIELWIGVATGALMLVNAFFAHRQAGESAGQPLRPEPTIFTLLAFAGWLTATWFNTTRANLPLVLAAETVALTFSIYLLRIREVALLGQFFLIFGQFAWLFHFINTTPPWWNPLLLIAVTVGLSHWWQRQKQIVVSQNISICFTTIFALACIAVLIAWLHPLVQASAWLALTSLLAVAVTLYGIVTRAWPLAICGQIFLAISAWEYLVELVHGKPEWYYPLAPLAGLGIFSFGTTVWFARKPEASGKVRAPLLQVAMVYRWVALAMSLLWVWQYVPERQRVGAYALAAVIIFALAIWRRSREALMAVAVYLATSLAVLWLREDLKMDAYWMNLLSLLAILSMQQILRRKAGQFPHDEKIHAGVIFIAGLSLWRLLSCWVTISGIFLTMCWAGFAVIFFGLGMALRERFHRWFGLGVLAAAVGRVVLVDVWKQETIYRVLTFMALGVALLVVGFMYNKYQETIRKWL